MGTNFEAGTAVTAELKDFARARNVKYFMISYTDLFGGQRAKLVPAQAISDMQKDGAGFAGFAGGNEEFSLTDRLRACKISLIG